MWQFLCLETHIGRIVLSGDLIDRFPRERILLFGAFKSYDGKLSLRIR